MFQILVIDDDPVIQMVLQKLLHEEGYQVTTASSGKAGIAAAKTCRPALIICDWQMSGMDGLAVCRHIKADPQLTSTFFILLTSRTGIEDRVLGLDTGADDFLPKPIEINELRARVRSGLRLYQSTQELQQLAQDLQTQKERLEAEFAEAAAYVRSRLPQPLTGTIAIETQFLPSSQLGGDCFDHFWLDPDFLAVYLLDVSGHGLGSALLSVSVQNILRSQSLPEVNFYQPSKVLSALNEIFQMDKHHDRYFTLWYGVYNRQKRHLLYASAGHPPAVLLLPSVGELDAQPPAEAKQLKTRGMPIGMLEESQYRSEGCQVPPGSTLVVFSDGVYEIMQPDKTPWSLEEFTAMLTKLHKAGEDSVDQILQSIRFINGNSLFEDDCSLMRIKFE